MRCAGAPERDSSSPSMGSSGKPGADEHFQQGSKNRRIKKTKHGGASRTPAYLCKQLKYWPLWVTFYELLEFFALPL